MRLPVASSTRIYLFCHSPPIPNLLPPFFSTQPSIGLGFSSSGSGAGSGVEDAFLLLPPNPKKPLALLRCLPCRQTERERKRDKS